MSTITHVSRPCRLVETYRDRVKMIIMAALAITGLGCGASYGQAPVEGHMQEYSRATTIIDATGFEGTVVVRNYQDQTYQAGHADLADTRFIPASSFKIFSAMVALEAGVIASKDAVIKWDGIERSRPEINKDLDLQSAFRLSAVPHFQELVRRIGHDRMQHFIDAVGYGNQDISGGDETFWLTGALRISPREQVDFLVRLYENKLPFSSATIAAVKEMMISERTSRYTIRSKTGLATFDSGENTGWWVGWVESGPNVYMFASLLHAINPAPTFVLARVSVARETLQSLRVIDWQLKAKRIFSFIGLE